MCEICDSKELNRKILFGKPAEDLQISIFNTIYHKEFGVLCQGYRTIDGIVYDPIAFKDRGRAYRWIDSGCISELQEGLGNLCVGFTTVVFKPHVLDPVFD